jgi:hypothetical protein
MNLFAFLRFFRASPALEVMRDSDLNVGMGFMLSRLLEKKQERRKERLQRFLHSLPRLAA